MASTHIVVSIFIALIMMAFISNTTNAARAMRLPHSSTATTLAARLKVGGEAPPNCWESLFELQACTGEVITFFLNGETYLGPSCCRAIRIVGHDCWPGMLHSLGYTSREGDILQGYCDAEEQPHFPPSPITVPQVLP
ncbi:egg cell-secreted protein 1.1-like [Lotus japonicus]|uniref:egg cell-secreted protein 1.1-like n=1 Tax=Lotus japonicus TaxID=34305 RepID=UPI0025878BC4|nr:egg cell-secreted protein 1.1-like [Lotus japonicus]